MTEAEWLNCTYPQPMLRFLRDTAGDRKLRLFAVACCRNVLDLTSDPQIRASVRILEQYAEGLATRPQRSTARRVVHLITQSEKQEPYWDSHVNNAAAWAAFWAGGKRVDVPDVIGCCMNSVLVVGRARQRDAKMSNGDQSAAWRSGREIESSRQAFLFRDILGNPFRPVALDPSWLDPAVTSLAQTIYDSRSFERMPELADALERSECHDTNILAHCRGPGLHARGCWVVDLLLGKN